MSIEDMTIAGQPVGAYVEIAFERNAQDHKWGPQNHQDICHRGGMGLATADPAAEYGALAAKWKHANDQRVEAHVDNDRYGHMTDGPYIAWDGILLEEVFEALEQIGDDVKLREELIQSAAVIVAWVEAIDRRSDD